MKTGDNGFFIINHTGNDLEENFAGVLFGIVDIGTAETHLPDLRSKGRQFKSSDIRIRNRFADGFKNIFAGLFKIFDSKFGTGFFGEERDELFGIIFNECLQKCAGKFILCFFDGEIIFLRRIFLYNGATCCK